MKKLIGTMILSLGLLGGVVLAEDTSKVDIGTKVSNHISNEIEKTKEFQKKNWLAMKKQFADLISKFSNK